MMAMYLLRSAALKTLRCNFNETFKISKQVTVKFHQFTFKPLRVSNLIIQQRSHYWVSGIMGKQTEITLKNLDKVPNDLKMIYRHDDLDLHFRWLYLAACIMAGVLVGFTVVEFDKEAPKLHLDEEGADVMRYEYLMGSFFFTLLFMLFHGCMKRMPVRIYRIPRTENYVFIVHSSIPFTTRRVPCKRGQCVRVDPNTLPSWVPSYDIYKITNEQVMFIFEDAFKKPADLHVLLGIQDDYEDK